MKEEELKVLLIEDNPGDAFLIKFYLGESTAPVFHLSHAETVSTALDILAKEKFDLILSDMNLPDSSGVETIKSVLEKFPGNLVIVLTGLTDEEVGLETVRYGAQDFLVKGKFDGKILISSVLFAFERFKLNKQIDSSPKSGEGDFRFDSIQRLLNAGYLEFDGKNNSFFCSSFVRQTMSGRDKKIETLQDFCNSTDKPQELDKLFKDAVEKGDKGQESFTTKEGGEKFLLKYEGADGKICGVIQKV